MLASAAEIEAFVGKNLDIGPGDVPGLGGLLKKPLSYRLGDVITLSLSPLFEDVATGTVIDASGVLEFK